MVIPGTLINEAHRIAWQHGVTLHELRRTRKQRRLSPIHWTIAHRLHAMGASTTEIGAVLDRNPATVSDWIRHRAPLDTQAGGQ